MSVLDRLCRTYQKLFPNGHPEQARLVELHSSGQSNEFLRAYFDHEYEKGKAMVERFAAITRAWEGGRTLDFGCGAGGLTYRVRERSQSAVGIDLEADKIQFGQDQAKRLGVDGVELIRYDGGAVPLPDASFDTLFCVDVMEHLPDPAFFVGEFHRLLKPGGHLLISFGPPWGHAHGKHMWHRYPGWWTHLLFPRAVVMRSGGYPADTTYESLGLHRLTVGTFETIMRASPFRCEYLDRRLNKFIRPLKYVPGVRELVIAEVVGVYRKP